MEGRFPDVSCPRCHELAQLFTVPLVLIAPTAEENWQALCGECFRSLLQAEPWDDLLMRSIHHGSRRRR